MFNYKRGASAAFLLLSLYKLLYRAKEWNGKTPDHGFQGEPSRDGSQTSAAEKLVLKFNILLLHLLVGVKGASSALIFVAFL